MNSLKFALSTKDTSGKNKGDVNGSLLKGVNKSKSQSLWALDVDTDEAATEQSLKTDNLMKILNDKLQGAFQRDSKAVSDITFERVIQEFQDQVGGSKSQLSFLLVIQDKLNNILQFSKDQYKHFLEMFSQLLSSKIAKLRKREKKSQLSNFDEIASGGFKKKSELNNFLTVIGQKQNKKSNDKNKLCSKSPRKDESSENKLKRLFSKDKKTVKQRQKGSFRKEQGEVVKVTSQGQKDESITFTAVLSTSVGVKSRRRKASNEYKQKKVKAKKTQNGEDEKEEGEEAFIFFRPKKGKR